MKATISVITFAIALAGASQSGAQNTPVADTTVTVTDTSVAPQTSRTSPVDQPVAVRREDRSLSAPLAFSPANAGLGQAKALMFVGGAALITGAVVGGDSGRIIMVGGAVIGLYGLYQYLK